MTTWTAITTIEGEVAGAALGEAMEMLEPEPTGIGVFKIEDESTLWKIEGYFDEEPDRAGLALLSAVHKARDFKIARLEDKDWVAIALAELPPVEAGRFFLFGSHDADKLPEDRVGLLIEATTAFGTGHHNSTKGCLLAFGRLLDQGLAPCSTADIGAGTAVLAIASAKVWPNAPLLASDIDPVATETAEAGFAANGLEGRATLVTAAGFEHEAIHAAAPFGLVFANILKVPLIEIARPMAAHTAQGGLAILAGIVTSQADEVLAAYAAAGFAEQDRVVLGEWVTLILKRAAA